jgi:hypothetical protein
VFHCFRALQITVENVSDSWQQSSLVVGAVAVEPGEADDDAGDPLGPLRRCLGPNAAGQGCGLSIGAVLARQGVTIARDRMFHAIDAVRVQCRYLSDHLSFTSDVHNRI